MTTASPLDARAWMQGAAQILRDDAAAAVETPLVRFPLPESWGIDLYFKDESAHPTGSLKHRLARALLLHAVMDGAIGPGTTIVEASSGSTAVSEAYFARLLGLPFVAVVPQGTSRPKVRLIESFGGRVHEVQDAARLGHESQVIADQLGGHFVDQFANASRVTDWVGETSLAAAIFRQMAGEAHPIPTWIVVGAGTGGTITTLGRYTRSRQMPTRVALADPEGSSYFPRLLGDTVEPTHSSRIEGIGRPSVEASFIPSVVDAGFRVDDRQSIAAMRIVSEMLGIACGPSTGTNFSVAMKLIAGMRAAGETGSIVTLLCDGAERYADTYYNDEWLALHELAPGEFEPTLREVVRTGVWVEPRSPQLAEGSTR